MTRHSLSPRPFEEIGFELFARILDRPLRTTLDPRSQDGLLA